MEEHDEQGRPDDASDLFGYPPKKRHLCPSCARMAEGYYGHFCWLCTVTGAASRKLAHPTTTDAERDEWSGLNESIRSVQTAAESA